MLRRNQRAGMDGSKRASGCLSIPVALALWLVLASRQAAAQGCAMCYQTAAASDAPGREALRHGILVLLVPAAALFLGVLALVYRRRNLAR